MKSLNARSIKGEKKSIFNVTMEINGVSQLNKLTKKLRAIQGVEEIIRANN